MLPQTLYSLTLFLALSCLMAWANRKQRKGAPATALKAGRGRTT